MAIKQFWECSRCGKHMEQSPQPFASRPVKPATITFYKSMDVALLSNIITEEYIYCSDCEVVVKDFLKQRMDPYEIQVKITADTSEFEAAVDKVQQRMADEVRYVKRKKSDLPK